MESQVALFCGGGSLWDGSRGTGYWCKHRNVGDIPLGLLPTVSTSSRGRLPELVSWSRSLRNRVGATFSRLHTRLGSVGTEVQVCPSTSVLVLPAQPLGTVKGTGTEGGTKESGLSQLSSLIRGKWPMLTSLASQERSDCPGFELGRGSGLPLSFWPSSIWS